MHDVTEHPDRERLARLIRVAATAIGMSPSKTQHLSGVYADEVLALLRPEAASPPTISDEKGQDAPISYTASGLSGTPEELGPPPFDKPPVYISKSGVSYVDPDELVQSRAFRDALRNTQMALLGPEHPVGYCDGVISDMGEEWSFCPLCGGRLPWVAPTEAASPPEGRDCPNGKHHGPMESQWVCESCGYRAPAVPVDCGLVERIKAFFDAPSHRTSDADLDLLEAATLLDEALAALEPASEPRAGEVT